jgi:hypothetical protein
MNDKCNSDQFPRPQKCEGNSLNYKRGAELTQKSKKSGLTMS